MNRPSVKDRASLQLALAIQTVAMIGDGVSVFAAFYIAYELRYRLEFGGTITPEAWASFSTFTSPALAATALVLIVFPLRGVYQVQEHLSMLDVVPRLTGGFSIVVAGVILMAFFFQFTPSRLIFLYVFAFGLCFMFGHRIVLALVKRWLLRRGVGVDRVLIIGEREGGRRIMQSMLGNPDYGYRLVGYAGDSRRGDSVNVATENGVLTCPRLGDIDQIGELVERHRVDEVVVVDDRTSSISVADVIDQCRGAGVKLRVVPDLLQMSLDRVDFSEINGVPTIGIRDASIRGWNAIIKRFVDLSISSVLIVLAAIPMAIIAILIKRDSPGPVFYTQTRVGKYGQPFTIYKFRCMVTNADQLWSDMVKASQKPDGGLWFKDPDDPRITKVGKRLRRLSIDELPQIFNVLRGDMSLIGPRPPLPVEVVEYKEWHLQRLLVRPGLTGLWQVNGRSDLAFDEMVRLDLYYAENWTLWMDIKIMLRTIPAVLLGRGAY